MSAKGMHCLKSGIEIAMSKITNLVLIKYIKYQSIYLEKKQVLINDNSLKPGVDLGYKGR